jgi:hypothetical protein
MTATGTPALVTRRSAYRSDRNFAEFDTGTVTLNVSDPSTATRRAPPRPEPRRA